MKPSTMFVMAAVVALGAVAPAQAGPISLSPATPLCSASSPPVCRALSGNENGQAAIDGIITTKYPGLVDLYKGTRDGTNTVGISSEAFSSSYSTTFFNADLLDADARISWVDPKPVIASSPVFAYIKDGNATPNWYLFDMTGEWDGTESLEFSGFFPKSGGNYNISHVAIYGYAVPDGGSGVTLMGLALAGLASVRRRWSA